MMTHTLCYRIRVAGSMATELLEGATEADEIEPNRRTFLK